MRTESRGLKSAARAGMLTILVAALPSATSWAQTGGSAPGRSLDETIDVALNAIQGPVIQPLLVPPGSQPGIPALPPYKQEPPAAQRDFRTLTSPTVAPPPNPAKGAAGSPGGAVGGGKPPGNPGQFPPPNIDPTPPDNGLPPPGPELPLRPLRRR